MPLLTFADSTRGMDEAATWISLPRPSFSWTRSIRTAPAFAHAFWSGSAGPSPTTATRSLPRAVLVAYGERPASAAMPQSARAACAGSGKDGDTITAAHSVARMACVNGCFLAFMRRPLRSVRSSQVHCEQQRLGNVDYVRVQATNRMWRTMGDRRINLRSRTARPRLGLRCSACDGFRPS